MSFARNVDRFTGFADLYDRHRATPPTALATLITQFGGMARPRLVVDLGSGTGLSTRYWADRADRVVGVEPTPDMRHQAEAATKAPNIAYREGFSHHTGLADACAQVVVCMQALHWMDPTGTFAEAARILEPGGVFAACDYDWPPLSGSWEVDSLFERCVAAARRLEKELKADAGVKQWDKAGHFSRMQTSGRFRYLKDTAIHHQDEGNAERLIGLYLSQGYVMALLRAGVTEQELGLTELRALAEKLIGSKPRPFFWSARVRLGLT